MPSSMLYSDVEHCVGNPKISGKLNLPTFFWQLGRKSGVGVAYPKLPIPTDNFTHIIRFLE